MQTSTDSEKNDCRPYVLFIGGFMDGYSKVVYQVYEAYKAEMDTHAGRQYVYYQRHYPWYRGFNKHLNQMIDGQAAYFSRFKQTVVIVAHSWGATTAMRLIKNRLALQGMTVRLLVTCDPVGSIKSMQRSSAIERWRNVYVDYTLPGNRFHIRDEIPFSSNTVAKIDSLLKLPAQPFGIKGGPLGASAQADVNEAVCCNGDPGAEVLEMADAHAQVDLMFAQVKTEVAGIL
ncbi:MAG: Abhydrolase family protein [Candidatus Tokpelaia hoelldobleri]|uniref:Abhydrolase family protein n=1 Tax=Candidatus Tokpelaia hoelldobleri TaxID=1902579 RepID=A0A1U9JWU0_9HYPH|nr:MAG: Abhydrolase family protein [Candidatus Tokpelaia hoelldoblerii]